MEKFPAEDLFVIRSKEISSKFVDKNQFLNLTPVKNNKSIINYISNYNKFRATCWNFIVKNEFIQSNNIYFKDIITYEDQVFVSEILCLAQSFKVIEQRCC